MSETRREDARREKILSVVVPCHNEVETLPYTHQRLLDSVRQLPYDSVEILYVNDGSGDGTGTVLTGLHARHLREPGHVVVTVLEFSRNFGHSSAVLAGLTHARGQSIAIIDADLQDPPEILGAMLRDLDSGQWDVVYGQRQYREQENAFKKVTAWTFYRLLNLMTGFEIPRDAGDFRVITSQVRDAILRCRETDLFIRGIVAWVGFRQKAFPYVREARKYGHTKYGLRKMIRFASLAILSFSSKPLRLGIYLGFLGLALTLGILVWGLVAWSRGSTVPGWASLLGAFLCGQSFILMLLGVIGTYIGRIYTESQGRPRFILRDERSHPRLLEKA